jgi:hypothetical protein
VNIYGRNWTRDRLEARVGRVEQVGGIRRVRLIEGTEEGTEQIEVRTGAGLSYMVTPSRGMDISLTVVGDVPISWQSPNKDAHPSYYDPAGNGWLRTAAGGLLMTCGLTQVGASGADGRGPYGLHGRMHHTPASQVAAEADWDEDEYRMEIRGIVEETSIFGDCLRLKRTISSCLGENSIRISDVIENTGFNPSPFMLLYHFNFGFPLMDERTILEFPAGAIEPRDQGMPLDGADTWQEPDSDFTERVYYRKLAADQTGRQSVRIRQPHFPLPGGAVPLEVELSWNMDVLPNLIQWQMPGAGVHVLGLEPANCRIEGRAEEAARGTLMQLAPREKVRTELFLNITMH